MGLYKMLAKEEFKFQEHLEDVRREIVRASGCCETGLKDAMCCDHPTQSIAFSSTEICLFPEPDTVALAILAHGLVVKSHTPAHWWYNKKY